MFAFVLMAHELAWRFHRKFYIEDSNTNIEEDLYMLNVEIFFE